MSLRKINPLILLNFVIIFLITCYQWIISPLFPKTCRFYPSCSAYSREAFHRFNLFTALWLSGKRILKCHPFHPGGYDPLPHKKVR